MKKSLVSLVAATVLSVPAMAEDVKVKKDPKAQSLSAMVKLMHIVDGAYTGTSSAAKDNKLDPNTGSAALANIKYKTKSFNNLSGVFNFFMLADTGLTDRNNATESKEASGMFINNVKDDGASFSILGEAYLNYKTKVDHAKVGRQIWKTPLTTIKFSTMPTFFEGASYQRKVGKELKIHAAHMTRMAFGARAYADAALIGESTNTAGAVSTLGNNNSGPSQGSFVSMSRAAGYSNDDSAGMTSVGVTYKKGKKLTVRAWDYIIHDMANNLYVDAEYKHGLNKKTKLIVGAQYLSQSYDDSGITGGGTTQSFNLSGVKVALAGKMGERKYKLGVATNSSGGEAFVNVWGADPAYTSTIFSRNEYRKSVSAVKYSAMVGLAKGLKLVVAHANYGQSETASLTTRNDATETDIVLVYKPNKKWMFKIFNAQRKTEKDDNIAFDHTQNHTRMVGYYKF